MKYITATLLTLCLTSSVANAGKAFDDACRDSDMQQMQQDVKEIKDKQINDEIDKAHFD